MSPFQYIFFLVVHVATAVATIYILLGGRTLEGHIQQRLQDLLRQEKDVEQTDFDDDADDGFDLSKVA